MSCFTAMVVVVVVAAEQAGVGVTNLLAVGIVIGVTTEKTGFAATYFLAMLIVMMDGAEDTLFASAFVSQSLFLPSTSDGQIAQVRFGCFFCLLLFLKIIVSVVIVHFVKDTSHTESAIIPASKLKSHE